MIAPADDIDRIMAVMAAAFDPAYGEAWTRRQVEDAAVIGNCHATLIAADGTAPAPGQPAVGFALVRAGFEEDELLLLGVIPEARGRGLGGRLLTQFAAAAAARGSRRLLLEMRADNPAIRLYERAGFVVIGRRPNYYRAANGTLRDALTFCRELPWPL